MNTTTTRKRLRRTLVTFAVTASLLAAPNAFSWSRLGHWLVGDLAQTQLTPAAQQQVTALLQGEPDPTLAGVASWADGLRSSDPELGKKTSKWHYIDLDPQRCEYRPPVDCPGDDCVIAAIDAQRKILADTTQTPEARRVALKFVVHFIGDVHQPLHAGSQQDAEGHDDAGGNKYQISLRTATPPDFQGAKRRVPGEPIPTNLHAVWDYYELESAMLPPEKYAAKLQQDGIPQLTPQTLGTPVDWAIESCKGVNAQGVYPLDSEGQPQHKIGGAYLDAKRAYAEARVRIAAGRLAAVLNETLK